MEGETSVRIDKWLWAVRLFKTRNQATEACRGGKVKMKGQVLKASHEVKAGEIYEVSSSILTRTIVVKALLYNRVGAALVEQYLIDNTPPEEMERLQMQKELNYEQRDRGAGRPTKRQRRLIGKLKDK